MVSARQQQRALRELVFAEARRIECVVCDAAVGASCTTSNGADREPHVTRVLDCAARQRACAASIDDMLMAVELGALDVDASSGGRS